MPEVSAVDIAKPAEALQAGLWDLLVVGGGIVGAGVARDAALRGLRVALVEQRDFAFGTSGRSSRLLHGGIRYLAQGRIGLVREASREKKVLHRIAPHLAEPLAFVFPTRRRSGWPRWKLGLGVKLYDLLCGGRNLGRSRVLDSRRTCELAPGLSTADLTGSVRYYDAMTNDARLTIDTLRSARSGGALVANYARFDNAEFESGVWRCRLRCLRSDATVDVAARCVVNATGPWSDCLPNSLTELRLTKGVHLVVDRSRLPIADAVVMAEGERILFAIPWGERVILGTTDTDYSGPLDAPTCDASDMHYVLDVVNESFPAVRLGAGDVISTWAGLRPLVADRRGNPSDISRRHEVAMNHPGWWDVTGGKLTTYRLMAQETLDDVSRYLGNGQGKCRTAELPLAGDGAPPLASGILPPPIEQEVVADCCRREWAVRLDDVMIRRTSWRYYHADHQEIARQAAGWMQAELGWSDERREQELAEYLVATSRT
ncbi:MAG: glycerol-3-phosphate dehydrogenase/oxidase [Pirellulales bacterium]|nr:glycerol-3-phosphate dehydrogenase/oxidase [Pirellulales bacterium]